MTVENKETIKETTESSVEHFTTESLQSIRQKNPIVVVDYWAPWCGPCRAFGPTFERVAQKYPHIIFGKVNVDEEEALAVEISICSIPTIAIFKDGTLLKKESKAMSEAVFEEFLQEVL